MSTAAHFPELVLAPTPPSLPLRTLVDLDTITAKQLVYLLVQHPGLPRAPLLVDCGTLHVLRTRGVSHVVSELLLLHQSGAQVWLRNASPTLQRCLRLLGLEHVLRCAD